MKNIINNLAFFSSAKMIHKSMNKNLELKHTNQKIHYGFDENKKYFLYIHIPFCHEFCSFCSFHKFKYNEKDCKDYFANVRLELLNLKERGLKFDTMYIGGGTPLIDAKELLKTIEFAKGLFCIKKVSCETTPNHIQSNVLRDFDGLIDRLSIGVQSFDNEILKRTSRYEKYGSSEMIQEKISKITGILPVVSIDLIFNFPNQSQEMLRNDLRIAKQINAEQIVTYPLMTSKLKNCSTLQHFKVLQNSNEFNLYKTIKEELKDYHKDNAWSFSKSNFELKDEYIVDNSEYIGVGSGAFTHINNHLYVNAYDLKQYENSVLKHDNPIMAMTDKFDMKSNIQYQFLVHLFGGEVQIEKFNQLFNVNLEKSLSKELWMLKMINAIEISKGKIICKQLGEFISLIMMREFYVGMDQVRSKLRYSMNTQND